MKKLPAVIVAVLAFSLLMPGIASGYPQGWTSDNLVATGTGIVDVSVKANTVHLVYDNNGVYYRRSVDKGVSWSQAVRLDGGTGSKPQVTAGAGDTVFVVYVGQDRAGSTRDELLVRRSSTAGQSWRAGFFAYAGSAAETIEDAYITHGCDNVSLCWKTDISNHRYIYWSPLGSGGDLSADKREVWGEETEYMDSPRIASDGTNVFIAYMGQDKEYRHWKIYCMRYDGSTTARDVIADESSHSLLDPDVSCQGPGQFNVVWTDYFEERHQVHQKIWNGIQWSGRSFVIDSGATRPNPRAIPHSEDQAVICLGSTGSSLNLAMLGSVTEIFFQAAPISWSIDKATGQEALVIFRCVNNILVAKRTDNQEPCLSSLDISGNHEGNTIFARANFSLIFSGVSDDWNLTGTDPTNDSFTNGVTSIELRYSRNQGGPWVALSTDKGSVIDNSPWSAVTRTEPMGDDRYFIKGILTDTAGNTKEIVSGPIILDKTLPTCSLSTDPPHDPNSWRTSKTTVTIKGNDLNLDHLEYKVQRAGTTGGSWTRYDGPFSAPEGRNDIFYRAVDKAGNTSDSNASLGVWVDTSAPDCSVITPAAEAYPPVDGTVLIVKGEIDDGAGEVTEGSIWIDGKRVYRVDHPEDTVIATPWNTEGKALGTHTVEIRAEDAAGHSSSSGKRTFQLVSNPATDWYFAEGNTLRDFEEYISVLNAGDREAKVTFDFMLETGQVSTRHGVVSKRSRATFNVKEMVDGEHDVSLHLYTDGQPVIVERPMYFNYGGKWTGGHTALGLNKPGKRFYFAEGSTREAGNGGPFEQWLCLQNPGGRTAQVKITYIFEAGPSQTKDYSVEPRSRKTVNVNADVGPNRDVSCIVESSEPLAVERPMYFNYREKIDGGHLVIGADQPSKTWYFAEGTTATGFDEYLTIQNPNDSPAGIDITFYLEGASQEKHHIDLPGRTRATRKVAEIVGTGHDVSAKIVSDLPVVAERPMYFNYRNQWTGGHDTLGSTGLGRRFYLSEGTTRAGFEEWLTVFSDSPGAVAYLVLIFPDGSCSDPLMFPVGRSGRKTIDINGVAGGDRDVSVQVIGDNDLTVERPIYFNYKGVWTGGHVAPGFSAD